MPPTDAARAAGTVVRGSWVSGAARVAVTVVLLALVLARVDASVVAAMFSRMSAAPLVAAFAWIAAAIAVSAWKWRLILIARGVRVGYPESVRLYLIGLFFNNVMPTAVGGDAVRAWMLGRETAAMGEAFASVVSERLIAGVALGLSSLVGLAFVTVTPKLAVLVGVFLAIDVAFVALLVVPRLGEAIVRSVFPRRWEGAADATSTALRAVRQTLLDLPLVAKVLVATVLFQTCVAMVNVSLFAALGHPVSAGLSIVYTPMISTVTMLPVSLSGLGVREAAYAYFFGGSSVPVAAAVAASLAFFVTVGVSTMPGAVLFVLAKRKGETDGLR